MNPWALIQTPHGTKWHIVSKFSYVGNRSAADLCCRPGLYAATDFTHPDDLPDDAVMCQMCLNRYRRRVEWRTELLAAMEAHR